MLFVTISKTWFVERIVKDGVRKNYLPLSSLKNEKKIDLPILTIASDEITNVWNVGRKIEKLGDNSSLPAEFLLLEEASEKNIEKIIDPNYEIKSYKTYYKYQDEEKLIYLYNIKKS